MNIVLMAILGGLLGLAVFDASPAGFWTGAAFGALAAWISRLTKRIEALEQQAPGPQRARPPPTVDRGAQRPPSADAAPERPAGVVPEGAPADGPQRAASTASPHSEPKARRLSELALEPSLFDVALGHLKRWFTTGNVPVKVGVVLSVFGVAFLVKEGIDRSWLVVPLEWRLAMVAAFGIALLGIGWRLRASRPSYAVSVQGGGIAVLYLTTYASFALYDLLPAAVALAFLVAITAAAGALAILQDARALAVLGIIGGFMAPVLTSTQSGDHVALFSYYAILNLAILGIAWFKAWRELNVLGFLFTFFIGSLWGYRAYTPEQFGSTEPFLVLFVMLYTLVPVLFATRQTPQLRGFVDGTLVFGTPIAGFALQSRLLEGSELGLAISAVALAVWYIGLATYLHRRREQDLTVLVESLFALAVAFATIAVPLALDARWTSAAWGLQGAAMIWLGFRQRRKLALAAGCALQLLAGAAYALQPMNETAWPLVNGYFIGALMIAAAGWFSSFVFDRARAANGRGFALLATIAAFVWASAWWLWAGFAEIDRHVTAPVEPAAALGFVAATALFAMAASKAAAWPRFDLLGLVLWPFAVVGAAVAFTERSHFFADYGFVAWPFAIATMFVFLRLRERQLPQLSGVLHALAFWLAAAVLGRETAWLAERVADGIWPLAAALAVIAALVLATLQLRERLRWPLAAHGRHYVSVCCGGVLAALGALALAANLLSPGDAAPLPYVPLLNPLEVASVFVLIVAMRWWRAVGEFHRIELPAQSVAAAGALLGLLLLTMAVARAVHHYMGVAFDFQSLASSSVLQAALSIVWGTAGLGAMVIGARGKHRTVWIGGAVLMAVVVVKLFLVELDNTGTLGRVISFLGVGLLLLVVGYFAPVPPRAELDKRAA